MSTSLGRPCLLYYDLMSNRKFRWSKVYESSEEELLDLLKRRNLLAERTAADEADIQEHQISEHDFTIWCAEGSLVLRQDAANTSLQPGDAVLVHTKAPYDLRAGITGYVCYITR
jgi:mannose-6-phosphate isomerase class I